MQLCLAMLSAVLLVLLLGGCPEKQEPFTFRLWTVRQPADGPSTGCGKASETVSELRENTYTLRLTFMQRARDEAGAELITDSDNLRKSKLICDLQVNPQQAVEFLVDKQPGEPENLFDVQVEAYSDNQLNYVGRIFDVDMSKESSPVYLRPTIQNNPDASNAGFSCVDDIRSYRAFHSATLLPNGQVILIGGLFAGKVAAALDTNNDKALATGSVEIYDPNTLSFYLTNETIPPRAFHHAQLLPSPPHGPYEILLIGGVQPANEGTPAFGLKTGGTAKSPSFPFLFSPYEDDTDPAKNATAAPLAIVTYIPSTNVNDLSISYQELEESPVSSMFPATAMGPGSDGIALSGGASAYSTTGGFTGVKQALWVELKDRIGRQDADPQVLRSAPMTNTRVGHSMARLGSGRYIILGGHMDGNDADVAESFTLGSSTSFTPFTFASGAPSTAWHTLTPIGGTDQDLSQGDPGLPGTALWAGGYVLYQSGNMRIADKNPQKKALQLIRDGSPPSIVDVAGTTALGHFVSVGYHDAIRLYDGSVVLSGGNGTCTEAFCPSDQLKIYSFDTPQGLPILRQGIPPMRRSRLGHRMTRLLDNTILITGGITLVSRTNPQGQEVEAPELIKAAEVFNPRRAADLEDFPFNRQPMQIQKACQLRHGAASDGGVADVGSPDAGAPEGGIPDRGLLDGGATELGFSDIGSSDIGFSDGAVSDDVM